VAALNARIAERLPLETRGTFRLAAVKHNYYDDVFECQVVLDGAAVVKVAVADSEHGEREVAVVVSPSVTMQILDPEHSTHFALDKNVCCAVPQVFQRGSALKPKVDAWTLLGIWSLADKLPHTSKEVIRTGLDVRGLRIAVSSTALLREIREARRRFGRGHELPDYCGNAWREVRASLLRLAEVIVSFPYTTLVTPTKGRSRKPRVAHRVFKGSLLSVDVPDPSIEWRDVGGDAAERVGRQLCNVTLNLYDGVENNYYVLVSRCLFDLREDLDEVDTRLLLWLVARHRGRNGRGRGGRRFQHTWEIRVDPRDLVSVGVVRARRRHTGEAVGRLWESLEKLHRLGPIAALERRGDGVAMVTLSPAFFHDDGAKAPSVPVPL